MIKGCSRRVIYMKNTDSEIFDEAYFVLRRREEREEGRECDMVREAERIIRESMTEKKQKGRQRSFYSFAMGLVCASIFYTLLGLIIYYA